MAEAPVFLDLETLVLTRNGVWISNGQEVTHESTVRGFNRNIHRDKDGYYLRVGRDFKRFEVEDTAYFVKALRGDAESGYELVLSDDSTEPLDATTLKYQPGRLSCLVKQGLEEAKFQSAPYYELLRELQEDGDRFVITVGGRSVRLP